MRSASCFVLHVPDVGCMKFLLQLVVAFFLAALPMAASAQTNEPDTASSPRPKADHDGHFALKLTLGRHEPTEFLLRRFVQEGKDLTEQDAYVFYEPLALLETDTDGKILFDLDEIDKVLTLSIQWLALSDNVKEKFRRQTETTARERDNSFKLDEKTKPYRITALQPRLVWLEFDKPRKKGTSKLKSEPIDSNQLETGSIRVYFSFNNPEEARRAVEQLQEKQDGSLASEQLVLRYSFVGVSDQVCEGTLRASSVQELDLFKSLVGPGGEGTVTRKQAAEIADHMVKSLVVESRCADAANSQEMLNALMTMLGEGSVDREVADWKELEDLVRIDMNDFKADVIKKTKDIKNSIIRTQLEDAMSKASSNAETDSYAGGLKGGYGPFSAEISGSYTTASADTNAEAKRIYKESLQKQGIYGEFEGKKYIPKSVKVHTKASLQSAWGTTRTIRLAVKGARDETKFYTLTPDYRTASMPAVEWREVEERMRAQISDMKQTLRADISHRMEAISRALSTGSSFIKVEDTGAVRIRSEGSQDISHEAGGNVEVLAANRVGIRGRRGVDVSAGGKVAISGADGVRIVGSGGLGRMEIRGSEVYIDGRRAKAVINAAVCKYRISRRSLDENGEYEMNTGRTDDIAILSGFKASCDTRRNPYVWLARRGGDGEERNNWHLNIDNWFECKWIRARVLYLDGWGDIQKDYSTDSDFWGRSKRLNKNYDSCS